jgi:endonuclease-3
MNKKTIEEIFSRWQKQNPKPTTELMYESDYQLLVAVILSAQSTDKVVNQVTEKLFAIAPTAEKMLEQDLDTIMACIKRLGLYQQKAKAVLAMSQILVMHYQGNIPNTREDLEALPGVGRKTANVVLNTAFQIPVIAVDTHIFRLSHRLCFSKGKTPLAVEQDLMKIIPKQYLLDAHHWMILHGRYICQAKKPLCKSCLIQDLCPFYQKNLSQS